MKVEVKVDGMDKMRASLASLGTEGPKAMSRALFKSALNVEREAKRIVPVDTGALRASIHTEGPTQEGATVTVAIVAGGPAAAYAVYVHEDPAARHPSGEYKFIEKPVMAEMPKIPGAIREEVARVAK